MHSDFPTRGCSFGCFLVVILSFFSKRPGLILWIISPSESADGSAKNFSILILCLNLAF